MGIRTIVAAAVCAASLASPARAATLPGFACAPAPGGGHLTLCVKGEAQLMPLGAAMGMVVVACEAVTLGAVTTTIVGCQLNALAGGAYGNAPNVALPGPAAATGFMTTAPVQPYAVCAGANYVGLDGGLGSDAGWAVEGCFATFL